MQNLQQLNERASIDELAAFVAVVESGSFTSAASTLNKDATILSRRVASLEKRLGISLFSRTTRQVTLTEAGTLYYGRVRTLLDELDSAGQEVIDLGNTPQGLLRITVPVTFGKCWVAPMLPSFLQKYPKIQVDIRFSDRYLDIVAAGFDVAIRLGSLSDSSLVARQIAAYETRLYASPSYIKTHRPLETPNDLASHNCLGFTNHQSWPEWILESGMERFTLRPTGTLIADNSEALMAAATEGVGIVLLPTWLTEGPASTGKLVRVLPEWKSAQDAGIHALMPPGRLIPSKTRAFVETLSESIPGTWCSVEKT
jgi:DNA-binding transcriptional LysR family regulator